MKILHLNILQGCPEAVRLKKIVDFVKKQNPDVLGLSELNNWDNNNFAVLESFKAQTGFSNCVFANSVNTSYHLALFSKLPILSQLVINRDFKTAAVKAEIQAGNNRLQLFLTHLHSRNEDLRLKEVDLILQQIDTRFPALLMGDMNSLSPQDPYDENVVLAEMHRVGLDKFGQGRLRYEVVKKILDFGFVDSLKQFRANFEYSVPTVFNIDEAHFAKLRLDYIFVTSKLLPYLVKAEIIRTEETNQLSDHFPVVAEFTF